MSAAQVPVPVKEPIKRRVRQPAVPMKVEPPKRRGRQSAVTKAAAQLSPVKQQLFDAVNNAGATGIQLDALIHDVYRDKPVTKQGVRSHIWQLNQSIAKNGVAIRSNDGAYVLERT